jgi:hypothetical protein
MRDDFPCITLKTNAKQYAQSAKKQLIRRNRQHTRLSVIGPFDTRRRVGARSPVAQRLRHLLIHGAKTGALGFKGGIVSVGLHPGLLKAGGSFRARAETGRSNTDGRKMKERRGKRRAAMRSRGHSWWEFDYMCR